MTERKLQQRAFLIDKKTGINSSYLPAGDPGYNKMEIASLAHKERSRCYGKKTPSNLLDFADGFEEQAGALILRVIKELVGCAGFSDDASIHK